MSTQGKRLIRLDELRDRHMGRTVNVNGLIGVLEGTMPVLDRIALRLRVGGVPAFTDAYSADTYVEVWKEDNHG